MASPIHVSFDRYRNRNHAAMLIDIFAMGLPLKAKSMGVLVAVCDDLPAENLSPAILINVYRLCV